MKSFIQYMGREGMANILSEAVDVKKYFLKAYVPMDFVTCILTKWILDNMIHIFGKN